ncbi:MAG: hypothetical protein RLZZ106_602, partial [Cyanobacteriota bacterium]
EDVKPSPLRRAPYSDRHGWEKPRAVGYRGIVTTLIRTARRVLVG